MDSSLTFTVLTAIKDGFAEFAKTIPTVLQQSDSAFEWIIIDDGSGTPLASTFPELKTDPRVKIFRNERGQGQTKSLNQGISIASGEWIVRMDGDDLCQPNRFQEIRSAIQNSTNAQIIFSDYSIIDGEDRAWAEMRLRHPLLPTFFRYLNQRNNPICHPTVAFRKHRPNGDLRLFREDLVNAQDYALWREIFSECGPSSFVHIPSPTVSYRIVPHSLSGARAPEQRVELTAIRDGQKLQGESSAMPVLKDSQKDAMQAYRLLYYRFAGIPKKASLWEDLCLLLSTVALPGFFFKAVLFLLGRPLRRILLLFLFQGIYE